MRIQLRSCIATQMVHRLNTLKILKDALQRHNRSDFLDIFCKLGCYVFDIDDGEFQSIDVGSSFACLFQS